MMEEMQKAELEKMKKAMAKGKPVNPWEVDYDPAKSSTKETETLLDKAKAFSF